MYIVRNARCYAEAKTLKGAMRIATKHTVYENGEEIKPYIYRMEDTEPCEEVTEYGEIKERRVPVFLAKRMYWDSKTSKWYNPWND